MKQFIEVTGFFCSKTYNIVTDKLDHIICVEIPHQRKPSVWYANDEADFISIAHKMSERGNSGYYTLTAQEARDCWGDEMPDEVKAILETHGVVVCVDGAFFRAAWLHENTRAPAGSIVRDLLKIIDQQGHDLIQAKIVTGQTGLGPHFRPDFAQEIRVAHPDGFRPFIGERFRAL